MAKNATRRLMRWRSAGVRRWLRSVISENRSTSSTVHVFLIAFRYCSIEGRIRHRPEGEVESGIENHTRAPFEVASYWQASQLSGFSSEHVTAPGPLLDG